MNITSKLKTWLRRNGFTGSGPAPRIPMRDSKFIFERSGRLFRFRDELVDISIPVDDFDRWGIVQTEP